MTETTYEEARRCSKCQQPGEKAGEERAHGVTPGAKLHKFVCMNERCVWYGQVCRLVQVNPDGTIPPPIVKRDKQYPTIPDLSKQVNDRLAEQLRLEQDGHAEVQR